MAGGMGRGLGIPLRDRTPPGVDPPRRAPIRHCWVYGPKGSSGAPAGPWPAVLLEWRHDDAGWVALVVYVVTDEARTTTVQTWVEARHLAPVLNPVPAPPL